MKTYDILNAGPKNRFMANGKIVSNSGRAIQLQNLVRNELPTLNEARELIKLGCFDMVESIYANTPDVLSQLIRTMLIPKPGHEFIVADFSAIEARVLSWLAGEQWRLDAFNRGEDIYCASASAMFGVPVVKHGINGELRAKGKVAELACIAEGQLVLTDYGYVPIEQVQKFMSVWDGDKWVKHDGVVYRGNREVINYKGLTATPDHLVYFDKDKEPVPFSSIVSSAADSQYTVINSRVPVHVPVYDILNAGPNHRFLVSGWLVHNCGYQGSVGALEAFGALKMGLKEDDLSEIIQNWRQANPKIVQFWYDLENAAMETITDREEREVGKISVQFYGKTLWLVLPSGRKLAYINPKLEPNRFGKMSVTFMGLNLANKWDRIESYGGKLAENCIAEGTLVMTDQGLIPIESIKPDSLIWDGVEWVHHEGVIYKGLQETIEISSGNSDCKSNCNSDCNSVAMYSIYSIYSRYSGIYMTPEHKILTEKGWCECGKSDGLNWAEVRLPDGFETIRHWEMGRSAMGRFMRMWKYCKRFAIGINKKKVSQTLLRLPAKKSLYRLNRSDVSLSHSVTKSRKQRPRQGTIFVPLYMRKRNHNSCCRAKEAQNKIMRMHEQTINKQSPYNAWNEPASGIWSMAQYETTMPRSEPFCISQLWRAGYNSLRSLDTQLREFLGRHGPHMAKGARFRSYRQQQGILSRELSLDNSKKQFQKQKNKSNSRFSIGKNDSWRIIRTKWHQRKYTTISPRSWLAKRITVRKTGLQKQVYDIRNCGTRHRFTVWDHGEGCLRIVSNCTQATARDLLAEAMWRMEQAGLDIVAHIHDEVVLEVPVNTVTVDDVCKIMNQNPTWAEGLPLASAGYKGSYYFKD